MVCDLCVAYMRVQEFLRDKLYQQQQEDTVPDVQMAQRHQSYSKLDSIKDIRDELDQPLQPHIEPSSVNKCSYVTILPSYLIHVFFSL